MLANVASPLTLRLPCQSGFLGVATAFAEAGARALGLGQNEALKLTLGVEELFGFFAQRAEVTEEATWRLRGGGYYVQADLALNKKEVDLRFLNLAAETAPGDESYLEQLGLVLASRCVERLLLEERNGELCLSLIKEKSYPPEGELPLPPVKPLAEWRVAAPSSAQAKNLACLLSAFHPPREYPSALARPGQLADMLAGGEYQAVVAVDADGNQGGCFVWETKQQATVTCYGPYIFGQPRAGEMAVALVEACLAALAKSEAANLVCRYPTEHLPREYFEFLGDLTYHHPGSGEAWHQFYRQLKEDPGAGLWCHPRLEEFLRGKCRSLFLGRELRLTAPAGEARPAHSVFATRIDRAQGQADLRCLWDGADMAANLARHLAVLKEEGLRNLFFELDLGEAWQTHLVPDLLDQGFAPRLLLPWGGRGDLVVFQWSV